MDKVENKTERNKYFCSANPTYGRRHRHQEKEALTVRNRSLVHIET